jgi:glyoxylase-like metal-dependent hydrolase (beta-lactamase superfamily II)
VAVWSSYMNQVLSFPQIENYLAENGVSLITDIREEGKGAAVANTYFLQLDTGNYVIDPACGQRRLQQIKARLPFQEYAVLLTHSHLDHSANSGAAPFINAQVICHPLVAGKINNLKRNYTDITAEMVRVFGVHGFFGRTGMLGPPMIKQLQSIQKLSPALFNRILYAVSLVICRRNVGRVYPPVRNVTFLREDQRTDLCFANTLFRGWPLSEDLFALETPGHQDDHLSFYVPDRKIMFAGDLISFLNPNDILDGSLKDTHTWMKRLLQLAEAGGIDILAISHALPLIGKEQVITYLRSVIAKQEDTFNTVAEIVASCPDKSDFDSIMSKVYAHESELMKKILKINYPRTVSFIDVYVYLYLKEYFLFPNHGSTMR